ncbi:MAG: hypothetical protein ACFFD4_24465 [Candidatus Odinarchaeota archaeon]
MKQDQVSESQDVMTEQRKAAVKESLMDFVGHFSTASAILAGFYIATCAFIIGVRAESYGRTGVFDFLEEELLADTALHSIAIDVLATLNLDKYWPTNFQYMILIFISLFLLSLISYGAFMRVGQIQMSIYKSEKEVPENTILAWQTRGMNALFLSLLLGFISLPWALLRFVFDQALSLTILLLTIVAIAFVIIFKGWTLLKKVIGRFNK